MSHSDHRYPVGTVQPADHFKDTVGVFRVQLPGGFIRQQQGRFVGQTHCDCGPLLLPAG